MIFLISHARLVKILDHLYQVSACSITFMRRYASFPNKCATLIIWSDLWWSTTMY